MARGKRCDCVGTKETGCGMNPPAATISARFVEIAAVGPQTNRIWGRAIPGRVSLQTSARVNVGALIDGRVEEILVRPGDKVEAGTSLVRIQSAGGGQARAEAEQAAARL